MPGERCDDRVIYEIRGADRLAYLQGLVSNDIRRLADGMVYAALLSPQGKYLADFFLVPWGDAVLLDIKRDIAAAVAQRLSLYKLRADVSLSESALLVSRGLEDAPAAAFADPRHPALGWRAYGAESGAAATTDWDAIRVAHCVPETGVELLPNETFILEAGFERLSGVDFRKGCYVGQEVTARMKHKVALRKGLAIVAVAGAAPVGTAIEADGRPVGTLFTQSGGRGIAYLRLDRATGPMQAGAATVTRAEPPA